MAIVKMNKFTLFAFENKKEALLERLQRFEAVQFIDLQS
jgi:V/A-type H+-transporting ATPase subunit I